MPTDPDYGVHQSRTSAEELLIFSILSRAILDLFDTVGFTANKEEMVQTKTDALLFLTKKSGGWAKRRNELCEAVGIDGNDMRDRVVRVLDGDILALGTYEGRRELTQVAEACELWEYEKCATERAREAARVLKQQRLTNPKPKTKYIDARPVILALLTEPRTVNDLVAATRMTDGIIRTVLYKAIGKGEVEQTGTYFSQLLPQTAVAATTG